MTVLVEGVRGIAVRRDEPSAAYLATERRSRLAPSTFYGEQPTQLTVEVRRNFGGVTARSLLGGEFTPCLKPQELVTAFEVPFGDDLVEIHSPPNCQSELGRPLIAGLPRDFVEAVLVGLMDESVGALAAGVLRITRAGFDPAGSSENTFTAVGQILRSVVSAAQEGRDPAAAALAAMRSW
ncbi:hypothetical protein [Streptomyces sp. NPDC059076]|uniref:hypothetical protein n=1 Tax=unclassified Streptomyces TaxID=2593676 RepID=UPI00368BA1B9